jgi:hypothetical protein
MQTGGCFGCALSSQAEWPVHGSCEVRPGRGAKTQPLTSRSHDESGSGRLLLWPGSCYRLRPNDQAIIGASERVLAVNRNRHFQVTGGLSVEQIVGVLNHVELGTPVSDLIRYLGIPEQTRHRFLTRSGNLDGGEVLRCSSEIRRSPTPGSGALRRACEGAVN